MWDKREGLLSDEYDDEFNSAFNIFAFSAQGMAAYQKEFVIKNGVTYAYMEFEEPGDWPDLVLKLEDEHRRERMGADYVSVKR